MAAPKVSVCVPTYNGSRFLAQTLESIGRQTFRDYEVVIVDDQSQDDTKVIADRYAAGDSRVRVFSNEKRAGSSARNANCCLRHARGVWIKFLFQDDLMTPDCLARMLHAGETSRFAACWHNFVFEPDVDDAVRREYEEFPKLRTVVHATEYLSVDDFCKTILAHWFYNFIGPTSASFIHRDCFEERGAFGPDMVANPALECWIRLGSREGLAIVPEYLVSFRVHGKSVSAKIRESETLRYGHQLERVLLLLNLAIAPEYEAIRERALAFRSRADLEQDVTRAAEAERARAIDARYRKRDDAVLRQWRTFCGRHPELLDLLREADRKRGLIERVWLFLRSTL